MQDVLKRPTRPAGNNFGPDFLRNCIARIQETPIGAGLRFDPFEILHLAPAIFVIKAIMVQCLGIIVSMHAE